MSGYSSFASFYDPLTLNIDYQRQADYYQEIFRRFGQQPKLLLDLACGTGSLTVELMRRGIDVIGADASTQMLSIASGKAGEAGFAPLLLCQPMQKLDLYGTVDAAVCMLDSLNHLTRPEDVRETFRRLHLFVEPGGLFVFDVNTPYKHRFVLGNNTFVYDVDEVFCAWRCTCREWTVSIELDFFEREKGLYRRSSERFCERAYPDEDLRAWLGEAGFDVLDVYEDFSFRPVREESERAVYVVRRGE